MLLRRISIQNVRSFLDVAELTLDGTISIVIGPNGGGKTNLLDTIVVMLRKHLFSSKYARHQPTAEDPNRYIFHDNDVLNSLVLDRYTGHATKDQTVDIEIEITERDVAGMHAMRKDASRLQELAGKKYANLGLNQASNWKLDEIVAGKNFVYRLHNGGLNSLSGLGGAEFLQFLRLFEIDKSLREEFELAPLSTPLVYLPVNRAASSFQSSVQLAGYNEFETKRQIDGTSSRSGTQIVNWAVGRLASKYRLLLEKDKGTASKEFYEDKSLKEMTTLLQELGYEWSLETVDALKNLYDIRLVKQGTSFLVGAASSGEREILTYLFAIFALNVRDALIIVDEPELHLHPKWQKTLLSLFVKLANTTGNQFLLATHSPTFVSPESIQYVSRVFSQNQKSQILRLDTAVLPEAKHLLNIINSQNNERLFFADKVVLVEGLSDRIFFESVLDHFGSSSTNRAVLEIISVGGKGLFNAYSKILDACKIPYSIIADLDYIEQVGTPEIKRLFRVDTQEIKTDVIENVKSIDGDTLVASIDKAMESNNWNDAKQVWDYIKNRRRRLRDDLSAQEMADLKAFLAQKQKEKVFILSRGALEDYLPSGHRGKDLEKLIRLLADSEFWKHLPSEGLEEIKIIANAVLS